LSVQRWLACGLPSLSDDELHLADGDLGRLMDEVYRSETDSGGYLILPTVSPKLFRAIGLIGFVSPV
jgi:hypothetical protein